MSGALLGLFLALACSRAPQVEAPPQTRLAIRLPPPRLGPPPAGPEIARERNLALRLDLPGGPWLDGAVLQLPGLVGLAELRLDGEPVAVVQSGPGFTEVPLAGRLSAGVHHLELVARPDPTQDPVLRGSDGLRTPPLVDGPLLLLRPAAHVVAHQAVLRDGRVVASAEVAGAPSGAQVRFVLAQDGSVVADLGRAPVVDGRAESAPQAWRGPRWQVGRPALLTLHAVLEEAGGEVLDAAGQRLGLREVGTADGGFTIGGEAVRLAALRASPDEPSDSIIGRALALGVNAAEFHGAPAPPSILAALDEVGMAVALTPRCEGALRRALDKELLPELIAARVEAIGAQDRGLARSVAAHPSVVLWVVESSSDETLPATMVAADPDGRPVVGHHLHLANVMLGLQIRQDPYAGAWINETAWNGPRGAASELAAAYVAALEDGARGGVVEHTVDGPTVDAWRAALAPLDLQHLQPAQARATSRVRLDGASEGAVTWLSGPWLVGEASVVDASGVAMPTAWYQGPATAHLGGLQVPYELVAGSWTGEGRPPEPQHLQVSAFGLSEGVEGR